MTLLERNLSSFVFPLYVKSSRDLASRPGTHLPASSAFSLIGVDGQDIVLHISSNAVRILPLRRWQRLPLIPAHSTAIRMRWMGYLLGIRIIRRKAINVETWALNGYDRAETNGYKKSFARSLPASAKSFYLSASPSSFDTT